MFGNKEGSADCNILWGQDKHHTLTLHTVLQYNNYMKQYAAVLQCCSAGYIRPNNHIAHIIKTRICTHVRSMQGLCVCDEIICICNVNYCKYK